MGSPASVFVMSNDMKYPASFGNVPPKITRS
eukprot:CAMPEP_0196173820 /NCGR_PEP_ID=MMETSP0911-20130528/7031_1 /TAXON_ID=49265 /ORGANISM="Thalassiosira rotula, Strain GSO102" /LENGTH=30 /DNA_ID= /DNA_START= /DNA_END= /DNA_ORIENTATION=